MRYAELIEQNEKLEAENKELRGLLAKAKREVQALDIIKKKKVSMWTLSNSDSLIEYNLFVRSFNYGVLENKDDYIPTLESEEFDLLKEVLADD